jgi:hypothetical protein
MLNFHIESGHGLVSAVDFCARTAPLSTSALIAARNRHTGIAGAFHYPQEGLDHDAVRTELERWIDQLAPDEVAVTFPLARVRSGLRASECHELTSWLVKRSHCVPAAYAATTAGVVVEDGDLRCGVLAEIRAPLDPGDLIRVPEIVDGEEYVAAEYSVFGRVPPQSGNTSLVVFRPPSRNFS